MAPPPKKGKGPKGKKKKTPKSQVSCVIKYLVFGFNVFFWLVGGLILGAGIWAWTQKSTFENFSKITGTNLFDPVLFVIVIGAVIFVVGFFGCIGALRENTKLLMLYIKFMATTLVVLIVIVGLGLGFKNWLKQQIKKQLKRMIVKYRDDPDLQNMIDWMQADWLKCCGMSGPDDWEMNEYFNCSSPSREACGVPFSCCKEDEDALILNTQCGYDTRNPDIVPNPETKIYTDGCVDAGDKWVNGNLVPVAGVLIAVALVQLIAIFMACKLKSGSEKDRANKLYVG